MPASFLTGRTNFGPVNNSGAASVRHYDHTLAALPNGDWCMAVQFRPEMFRRETIHGTQRSFVAGTGNIVGATGGNDWYIAFLSGVNSSAGADRQMQASVRVGSVDLNNPARIPASATNTRYLKDNTTGQSYSVMVQPLNYGAVLLAAQLRF